MITTNKPHTIQGTDHNDDRWAAHLTPAIAEDQHPDLITIRTLDGNLHLNHEDAAALAAWLLVATGAELTIAPDAITEALGIDEPKPVACSGCGKPLGMTTALEIVDGLCSSCWEKAW